MIRLIECTSSYEFHNITMIYFAENGNISRHKKPPTILLSHRKWTFLNHGSWHCLPYIVVDIGKIEVYCLNEVSARYVALKADAKSLDILEGIRLRSWSVQLLTDRNKGKTYMVVLSRTTSEILFKCCFLCGYRKFCQRGSNFDRVY